jgi:hypothetical protein
MDEQKKNQFWSDLKQFSLIGAVFLTVFFIAGFWYYEPDKTPATDGLPSVEESIEQYKTQRYGEPVESECTFCGGIGKVGFAGESEKRHSAGKGNYCISCKGTGKIKTYPNKK